MTAEEWEELAVDVAVALRTFDWARSDALCQSLAAAIRRDPAGATAPVDRILTRLRGTRRFQSMVLLADALFESGVASLESGVQYAQALTDIGELSAAEAFLDWLSRRRRRGAGMASVMLGMRGRIAKQRHVNTPNGQIERAHRYLEESVRDYLAGFDLNQGEHYWYGINAVALLERARRRGMPVEQFPASKELAQSILATVAWTTESGRLIQRLDDRDGARSPHRSQRFSERRRCGRQVYGRGACGCV